jgi:ubiquinone/menaquinone biosynthesis C-methylase UbiE
VSVWRTIYKAVASRIQERDRAFELAYLRFGEARRWLVTQADLRHDWLVLEIGYGQGYLTMELASALTTGEVVGVDLLHENVTIGVTRWIAKQIGLEEKIALVTSNSAKLPFEDETFDAVVSFLALQDIKNTTGNEGVMSTIDEACRLVKKGGTLAIADDSFPCCRPKGEQGTLFDAIKHYWHKLLPPTEEIIRRMEENGILEVEALPYDPDEKLLPADAERELRLSVDWAKPFGIEVDFVDFWKEVDRIVESQGRTYNRVALLRGTKL